MQKPSFQFSIASLLVLTLVVSLFAELGQRAGVPHVLFVLICVISGVVIYQVTMRISPRAFLAPFIEMLLGLAIGIGARWLYPFLRGPPVIGRIEFRGFTMFGGLVGLLSGYLAWSSLKRKTPRNKD